MKFFIIAKNPKSIAQMASYEGFISDFISHSSRGASFSSQREAVEVLSFEIRQKMLRLKEKKENLSHAYSLQNRLEKILDEKSPWISNLEKVIENIEKNLHFLNSCQIFEREYVRKLKKVPRSISVPSPYSQKSDDK